MTWRRAASSRPRATRPRRWLALVCGPLGRQVAGLLRERGDSIVTLEPGHPERSGERCLYATPDDLGGSLAAAVAAAGADGEPLGVLHAWQPEAAHGEVPIPPRSPPTSA